MAAWCQCLQRGNATDCHVHRTTTHCIMCSCAGNSRSVSYPDDIVDALAPQMYLKQRPLSNTNIAVHVFSLLAACTSLKNLVPCLHLFSSSQKQHAYIPALSEFQIRITHAHLALPLPPAPLRPCACGSSPAALAHSHALVVAATAPTETVILKIMPWTICALDHACFWISCSSC